MTDAPVLTMLPQGFQKKAAKAIPSIGSSRKCSEVATATKASYSTESTEIGEMLRPSRSHALKVSEASFLWTCLSIQEPFGSLKFELALAVCMKALACVIHNVDSGEMGMGPQLRGSSTVGPLRALQCCQFAVNVAAPTLSIFPQTVPCRT